MSLLPTDHASLLAILNTTYGLARKELREHNTIDGHAPSQHDLATLNRSRQLLAEPAITEKEV